MINRNCSCVSFTCLNWCEMFSQKGLYFPHSSFTPHCSLTAQHRDTFHTLRTNSVLVNLMTKFQGK